MFFLKVWQNSQLWAQPPLFRDDETHCRLARRYLYLRICFAPRSQVCLFDPQSLLRWPLPVALHVKAGPKVGDGSCHFFTADAGDSGVIYDTVHSHVNWNSQRIVKGDLMDMLWHAAPCGSMCSGSWGQWQASAFIWVRLMRWLLLGCVSVWFHLITFLFYLIKYYHILLILLYFIRYKSHVRICQPG